MTDTITQAEGDALIEMGKYSAMENPINVSGLSDVLELKFLCSQGREEFIINYRQGEINLQKRNHHLRGKKTIGLLRLDLNGPPHRNPDGEEVGHSHLHIFKEGYGLKWAIDVPDDFKNLDSTPDTLIDFMRFCNVQEMPEIKRGLFS